MSVWNGQDFLSDAIRSILAQSYVDFEFIVIDDGSTDRSGAIAEAFARQDSRVRVRRQANSGLIDALNNGCALARGRYIARMDADDVSIGDRLMRQVDHLERFPRVGVVGGAVQFINAAGERIRDLVLPANNSAIRSGLEQNCVIVHPTVLMRKSAFESTGGYRKCVVDAEDYDLWLRMSELYDLANLEQVVLKRRSHPNQVSLNRQQQQVFSTLAAQAAARTRRAGLEDPLAGVDRVTRETLTALGVGEAETKAALVKSSLGQIRSMESATEYRAASQIYDRLVAAKELAHADRWVAADLRLFQARRCWRERQFVRGAIAASWAIATRPVLLGRPIRQALTKLAKSVSAGDASTQMEFKGVR